MRTPLTSAADKGLDRKIWEIAAPSVVALSLDPVLTMVDTSFVGNMESGAAEGLAAMGVSAAVLGVAYTSTSFFTNVATPFVAVETDAARKKALAARIVALGLACGALLCVALQVAAPTLVRDGPAASLQFTRIRGLAAPAVVAANALTGALRGFGDASAPLEAALLAAAANFGLDCALVPRLGANGAAVATTAAESLAALYLAARFLDRVLLTTTASERSAGDTNASSSSSSSMDDGDGASSSLGPFLRSAALTLARTLSLQLFLALVTTSVAGGGAEALAANHILRSAYSLLSFATDALAVAAQTLVATAPGLAAKQRVAARLFRWGAVVGLVFGVALFFSADLVVRGLTDDAVVAAFAAQEMRTVLAPLQLLSSLVFVADGVLQGATAFTYEAIAMAFSVALAAAVLAFFSGAANDAAAALDAAWLAVCVLQASRFSTFVFWWLLRFHDHGGETKVGVKVGDKVGGGGVKVGGGSDGGATTSSYQSIADPTSPSPSAEDDGGVGSRR